MIITLAQAKALLQITNTTYDTLIQTLIPMVQDDVFRYCNQAFQDKYIFSEGTALATVRGDPDTITDSESNWVNYGFLAGMDVYIEGGNGTNMNAYVVDTVAAGTLTLASVNQLIDQDIDDTGDQPLSSLRVSRINWPIGIQVPAAQMIWFQTTNIKQTDVKSERIDDYAVTYGDTQASYPNRILRALNKYRLVKLT